MGESSVMCLEDGGGEETRRCTVENNNYEGMEVTPSCFSVERLLKENQKLKEKLLEKEIKLGKMEEDLKNRISGEDEMKYQLESFKKSVKITCREMGVVLRELTRTMDGIKGKIGDIEELRFYDGLNKMTILVEEKIRIWLNEEIRGSGDWKRVEQDGIGEPMQCDLEQTEPEDSSEDQDDDYEKVSVVTHGLSRIKYNGRKVQSYDCFCGIVFETRSALRLHTKTSAKLVKEPELFYPVISKDSPPTKKPCFDLLKTEEPPFLSVPVPLMSTSTTGSSSPPPLSPIQSIPGEVSLFAPESPRIAHAVSVHDNLRCICGLVCDHTYILTKHIKLHMSDKKFSCEHCSKSFVNAKVLNAHLKRAHKLSSTVAEVYEQQNLKKVELELPPTLTPKVSQSRRKGGRTRAPDTILRSRFASRKRRKNGHRARKLIIRAKERIACPCHHCHRRFSHIADLLKHLARKIHGGEKEKPRKGSSSSSVPSTPGPSSVSTVSAPRRSARFSEGWKPQRCRCDLNCNRMKLQNHDAPSCTICGLEFVCLTILKTHFIDVHNLHCDIPKVCEKCGKLFNTAKQLQQHLHDDHVKSPSVSRPLPSGKLTVTKSTIGRTQRHRQRMANRHPRKHKTVPPEPVVVHSAIIGDGTNGYKYSCSCGRPYSTMKSLRKHIRQQTYGKVFKCPFCNILFANHCNLRNHYRRRHPSNIKDIGRYGCIKCGQTFFKIEDRINHQASEHREPR